MTEHEAATADEMVAVAARWLTNNPQVRERSLAGPTAVGKAPVDAFVTDPALAVEAVRSLVVQAVELDAPLGVVESLLPVLRSMVATINEREAWCYCLERVALLEGLRDESEVVPVLEAAIAEAPDAANEGKLRDLLDTYRRATTSPKLEITPDNFGAVLLCHVCGPLEEPISWDAAGCPVCSSLWVVWDGREDIFPGPGPEPIIGESQTAG